MISNSYRKGLSDNDARDIIRKFCPDVTDVEELEELWECVIEASKQSSISKALAVLVDRDPGIVLEIHQNIPWSPSPDEAILLQAFLPNYLNAVLLTYGNDKVFDDGDVKEDLFRHAEEVCKEVRAKSQKEFDATRRGA